MSNLTYLYELSHVICEKGDPSLSWGILLGVDSVSFFILLYLCIKFFVDHLKNDSEIRYQYVISKILLSIAFAIKAISYLILTINYIKPSNLDVFKYFLRLFPGYAISSAYLIILFFWFAIFHDYIRGKYAFFFKLCEVLIIIIIFVFVSLFFHSFMQYTKSFRILEQSYNVSQTFDIETQIKGHLHSEGIIAISFDLTVAICFFSALIILIFQLEIKITCDFSSPDSRIFYLCIYLTAAPIFRMLSRMAYVNDVNKRPNWECSSSQFWIFLFKEPLSQVIPLTLAVLSDKPKSAQNFVQFSDNYIE